MKDKRRLRILYLTLDEFPPFRADIVELFAKEFVGIGHKVDWVFQSSEIQEKTKITRWHGCVAIVTPKFGRSVLGKIVNMFMQVYKGMFLFYLVRMRKYDAIQVRDDVLSAFIGLLIASVMRIPFIYWMSFPMPESKILEASQKAKIVKWIYYMRGYISYFFLYKVIMRFAHHSFVQSEQMKEDMKKIGIPSEKMSVVLMGVDTKMTEDHLIQDPQRSGCTLGYLGTLSRLRHLDILVDILHEVRNKFPKAKLLLVGDGDSLDDRKLINDRAKKLGVLDGIEITGMLGRAEAWARIQEADVCLSPFYPSKIFLSTSPTKLIEYMALRLVTVSNIHPEQSRVVEESGCGVCVPWDIHAFADATINLFKQPKLCEQMIQNGHEYVKNERDYAIIAKKMEEDYMRFLL